MQGFGKYLTEVAIGIKKTEVITNMNQNLGQEEPSAGDQGGYSNLDVSTMVKWDILRETVDKGILTMPHTEGHCLLDCVEDMVKADTGPMNVDRPGTCKETG